MALRDQMAGMYKRGQVKTRKKNKVSRVMREFKASSLHSGSKIGPKVKTRKQAVAIGLSEQNKQDRGGY